MSFRPQVDTMPVAYVERVCSTIDSDMDEDF